MKKKKPVFWKSFLGIIMVFLFLSVTLSGQGKKSEVQQPVLKYHYPSDRQVSYRETTKVLQVMDINGQSMENNINTVAGLTLKNVGNSGNDSNIEVKIDSLTQTVDTPAGFSGGPIQDVAGKVFNIILSPSGKEVDNSAAAKITYMTGGGAAANALQLIENFFPVLPENTVAPGYAWTSNDSINSSEPNLVTTGTVKSENSFSGYELYNGINCAKFTSSISGERKMKTQSQGMDINMSGPYTGTVSSYFSTDDGYFIKQEVSTKMTGTIEITGPQEMSFPLVMEITVIKEVIK